MTNIYDIKKNIIKIIKFYFIGIIALIWNSFIMWFFSDYLLYNYKISILLIFIFNITVIFYLQKRFTFDSKEKSNKQILNFFILMLFLLSFSYFFIPYLKFFFNLNSYLALFIISVIITIINFLIQNFLIFKK
jgi:putative flippase GtrA